MLYEVITLQLLGHHVTFLVREGSHCSFADVQIIDPNRLLADQLPEDTDVVHFHFQPNEPIEIPYVITQHDNNKDSLVELDINTVFISQNHADRITSYNVCYTKLLRLLLWRGCSHPNEWFWFL